MIDSSNAYQSLRADLGKLREELKKLEAMPVPGVMVVTANMRVIMIGLASRVNELAGHEAARRMCGDTPPLVAQAPVDEMPLFANGHTLTADEIEAMERFRWRENDHTQDHTTDEEEVQP